jgi:dTDP-4-amino-4,6-dideoxygalactose transaminase
MYANHGALVKHQHEMTGINSRLDGLQAALLSAKLPYVEAWTSARQRVATTYDSELAGVPGLSIPAVRSGATNVYHLYVVRTAARDQLKEHLARGGVESAIHYPRALPFLPAYDHLGHSPDDFPTAARLPNEVLSLPMYPELTDDMIHHVVNLVREVDHSPRRGA